MNRLELVDRVAARNTASKAEVDRIIVSALEEIISAVRCGESVTLIGLKLDDPSGRLRFEFCRFFAAQRVMSRLGAFTSTAFNECFHSPFKR